MGIFERERRNRNQIAIPAQGIVDIRNALSETLDEYGSDEGGSGTEAADEGLLDIYSKLIPVNQMLYCKIYDSHSGGANDTVIVPP